MSASPRVGILGAGQLALMLAEAGRELGVEVLCAGRDGDCAEAAAPVLQVELDHRAEVAAFAARVDLVTIESENIDASVLRGLKLYPNERAVEIAQDRWLEKNFFVDCGIAVAPFAAVNSVEDFAGALAKTGVPAILKTRRMGYDGKGQVRMKAASEAEAAFADVGGVPCIVEGMVAFDTEVSLLAARNAQGEIVFWPLAENFHREGILRMSVAPFSRAEALQGLAERYMRSVMERLEYVGVLAIEFFVRGEELIANEMAPRVHNSGHWTIEGSETSQFANHLRAICGLPLGGTASKPMVMLNCIGTMPAESETAAFPLFRHDYGKAARPGRKVGHLTFPASETAAVEEWRGRLR